jgi:ABC-type transport system involved in multi-copper enzyme maturation permease subunit
MSVLVDSPAAPPGRGLSAAWASWGDRLAGALLLAAAGALGWYGGRWTLAQQAAGWGLLLLAGAALLRWHGVALVGPVLFYDLVRTGRRRRYALVRGLYGLLLLLILFGAYLVFFMLHGEPEAKILVGGPFDSRLLADFAALFFFIFLATQFLAVFLLAPAYTAGVLAEEKERQTLDALLATDLRNREIVFGTVVSRLANLALVILVGLPVLSLLQFLGGVEPVLVLIGYVALGLTMLSLAGLSTLNSLQARKPRDAILRTYLVAFAYLAVSGLSRLLLLSQGQLATFPSTPDWTSPVTLGDVVDWLNIGNIATVWLQLAAGVAAGTALVDLLLDALARYAWFHGLIAVGCCAWAVVRLRAEALPRENGSAGKKAGRVRAVSDRPMAWKEIAVDAGSRRGFLGWMLIGVLVAALFWPVLQILYFFDRVFPLGADDRLGELVNLWVRAVSSLIGTFMLLQVTLRAAGGVSGERDRDTLDGLLATPLDNRAILAGKWLGSLFAPRWSWVCLGLVWLFGLLTGGLHPLALPGFVLAWLGYAALGASLGLWFSVAGRTSRRTTFGTLFGLGVVLYAAFLGGIDIPDDWMSRLEAHCLLPPVALFVLPFAPAEYRAWVSSAGEWNLGIVLAEVLPWAAGAYLLWRLALVRFRVVTGRESRPAGTEKNNRPTPTPFLAGWGEAATLLRAWLAAGPLRPKRLVHAVLVLLPLGLLVGWYVSLRVAARQQLADAIALTDRLDPGWRLEELEARRKVIPEPHNAALQVQRVRQLLPPDWPGRELSPMLHGIGLGSQGRATEQTLTPDQLAALTDALKGQETALTEARRLADWPIGRFPAMYRHDGTGSHTHIEESQVVANLLSFDALLRTQANETDAALLSCRALLNTGRALGDEPAFWPQLQRRSIVATALERIERVLERGVPTEPALAALQRLLEDEETHPWLLLALRGGRAQEDRMVERWQKGDFELSSFFVRSPKRGTPVNFPADEELMLLFSGSLSSHWAARLRFQTECVEIAKLPADQQAAGFAQQLPANQPVLTRFLGMPVTRHAQPYNLAPLRCLLTALAVERYHRRHGCWPASLSELVPAQLADVPADPCDGNPLRYRRLPDGVVVYSVGADGTDDGGNLDRRNPPPAGFDKGVRLWDVERRQQPRETRFEDN